MFASLPIKIGNTAYAPVLAKINARDHAVGTNFRAVRDGVRHVRDQSAGLCADLAALNAKASIDAMRPVGAGTLQNADRSSRAHANTELGTAADQHIADASHRMGTEGIAVRITPRKIRWSRDRQFEFHQLVVGLQFLITDRPIRADVRLRNRRGSPKDESAA